MSKYEGLVFEGNTPRTLVGAAAPADSLPDLSRFGNDGVFTNAPLWTQLPSGLWYIDFVAATSQLITIGDIGRARTIAFWVKLDSNTESILQEELAGGSISAAAGSMVYVNWDNCFIDGVDPDVITAAVWHHVAITSTTLVSLTLFVLGKINVTYLDGGICKPVVYSYALNPTQINNIFAAERMDFGV